MEVWRRHCRVPEHRDLEHESVRLALRHREPALIDLRALRVLLVRLEDTELLVHLAPQVRAEVAGHATRIHEGLEPPLLLVREDTGLSLQKIVEGRRCHERPFKGAD